MATREEIAYVQEQFEGNGPIKFLNTVTETQVGMGAILKLLSKESHPLTAGQISSSLNISTARVAVLIKKLEAKHLIEIHPGDHDSRVKMVTLSDEGRNTVQKVRSDIQKKVGMLIDEIGFEALKSFIETFKKIKLIMEKNCPKL